MATGSPLMSSGIESRTLIRRWPYTVATLTLAVAVLVAAVFWHIDVFDLPGLSLIGIEGSEAGEVAIAFLLVIPALLIDRVVAREIAHQIDFRAEQLRVVRVTMRTVQDIVNNNLNQLQILRVEAEGRVPEDTLTCFDRTIHSTAAQITALANLEVFAERPMETGQGLQVPPVIASPPVR